MIKEINVQRSFRIRTPLTETEAFEEEIKAVSEFKDRLHKYLDVHQKIVYDDYSDPELKTTCSFVIIDRETALKHRLIDDND